jgi:hypothetical protein
MDYRYDSHRRFAEEFRERDGFLPEYAGRIFYRGPAVECRRRDLEDVVRRSPVRVQRDRSARGFVIYPA